MEYNLIENLNYCKDYVDGFKSILYYSHIPSAFIALLIGVFVYFKDRKNTLSKILILISLSFASWCFLDLVIWLSYHSASVLMFSWSIIEIFSVAVFSLSAYFVYSFLFKKDLSLVKKILLFAPILPILVAIFTHKNMLYFDLQDCVGVEDSVFSNYVFIIKILYALIALMFLIYGYHKSKENNKRREIIIIGFGIIFFLYSFFISGLISDQTLDYTYEIYGLFGMIVFMGSLSYVIVRFTIFNTKLISTQALVFALVILIGSQAFFIKSSINMILTALTFILVVVFGYFLVRGVKHEMEQRVKIEKLAKDLAITNDRLVDLNRQKSEFISFATHQLRAPITAMRGYLSLIKEGDMGEVPEKIGNTLEVVSASVDNLAVVVDDYLNVSRIELGTMKFDFVKSNVSELLNSVIIEMKQSIEKAKLSLGVKVHEGQNYFANMDVDKIRQVFTNVIDNSIKYTKIGGVEVGLENREGKIYFTVKDTGLGISKEEMPKLFNKFTRANNASETNIKGTGLGLYIAKEILLAHHGKIWAESEGEGKGTQFVVEIPESK